MEEKTIEDFVKRHPMSFEIKHVKSVNRIGTLCTACGMNEFKSENDMFQCVYGCGEVTCARCVSVGVPHYNLNCHTEFSLRHDIQKLDYGKIKFFMVLMKNVSKQYWMYSDLNDWYCKEFISKK